LKISSRVFQNPSDWHSILLSVSQEIADTINGYELGLHLFGQEANKDRDMVRRLFADAGHPLEVKLGRGKTEDTEQRTQRVPMFCDGFKTKF
jgi:hypothetical protein